MADTDIPDTARKIDARDKNVPWYSNNLSAKLSDSALELLLGYSKYRDREEVEKQVLKIVRRTHTLLPCRSRCIMNSQELI